MPMAPNVIITTLFAALVLIAVIICIATLGFEGNLPSRLTSRRAHAHGAKQYKR